MSAVPVAPDSERRPAPRLSLVRTPTSSVSAVGFIAIIAAMIALGLGGVLVVSTSVSAQSRDLTALRREATELGYKSASLESQLQAASSANALALRASQLGMVPNPYPAFINLADGSLTGVPTPVTGNEMPFLTGTTSALPSAEAAPESAQSQEPAATEQSEESLTQAPTDISAAGAADGEQP